MLETIEAILNQNRQIDMFEEYFSNEQTIESNTEEVAISTFKVLKSQNTDQKQVTSLSWFPDSPQKIAASYAKTRFENQMDSYKNECYIWDINFSNNPLQTLLPEEPVSKLCYNHKNVEQIGFGTMGGVVGLWDVREQNKKPALLSDPDLSHQEAVTDFMWLSSKGGSEFVTTSSDGAVKWWDTRSLNAPADQIILRENQNDLKLLSIGGSCLEYVAEYGPKYLVGSETGSIMLITKKPKKGAEINFNNCYGLEPNTRQIGNILSLKRNPFYP